MRTLYGKFFRQTDICLEVRRKGMNVVTLLKKTMVTPQQFNTLTAMQQATIIWQDGVLIGELYDKLYAYALYQVSDFYVEVKFSKANFILQHMCAFSSNCSHLDLYLKDIDISQIAYTF